MIFIPAAFGADESITQTIKDLYASVSPAGETRAESLASLEPLLAIPPEKRPMPLLDFLYIVNRNIR